MELIIYIAIIYSFILTRLYAKEVYKNEILNHNYQSTLRALADFDPSLAKYLEEKNNK